MFKNYFKIAWRNIAKNKKTSFINIGGLAIGMAVAILIGLWIWDEVRYDHYHTNYKTVAQIYQNQTSNGQVFTSQALPMPLEDELRASYGNNFKYITFASWQGDHILSEGPNQQFKNGIYIGKDGPKILSLKMLRGNSDALSDRNNIIISQSTAKAFFGDSDPINKLMKIDNKLDVKVTGVFEDLPYNTNFRDLKFLATWDLYLTSEGWLESAKTDWRNNSFQGFAQINENTNFATVNKNIAKAKLNRGPAEDKKYNAQIFLHPMQDWHLRSAWKDGKQDGGQIIYVRLFTVIGFFVLLLACINFMNLSTARSEKRAKEVGIRKTVGSMRTQLVAQFMSESLLVALIALGFSLLLTFSLLPWFNGVANKQIYIPWLNGWFLLGCISFAIFTGVLAGSYPALYLSAFSPLKVLKGTFKAGRFAGLPRKIMVVVQFTVSVALIIGTIIVYQQIQYTKNRPVGYDRNGLIMIYMSTPDFYGKYDILRNELIATGAISDMSESSSPLTDSWSNTGGYEWEGKDPNLDADFATVYVTHDYGKTAGFKIKEGRDFSRDFPSDSSGIILNEAAVKFMNLKNPVGKIIRTNDENDQQSFTIVGVIEDMVAASPFEPVKQTFFIMQPDNVNVINLRLNPTKSIKESLASIERIFKKIIPAAPFTYNFIDEMYASKFNQEERVGKLAGFFTLLAILISCLGLFGLASFVAEQRTKEIGIRKIVGASALGIWKLLSKEFILLVLIACALAIPLSYYYLNNWLQGYTYRVSIGWWVFIVSVSGALLITLITVSFQAIKAATANPVKSLRTE